MAGLSEPSYAPADPGDFRFEISVVGDPPHVICLTVDDQGEVISRDHFDTMRDCTAFIGAAREAQDTTLEERLGPYGIEWQREQEERGGW